MGPAIQSWGPATQEPHLPVSKPPLSKPSTRAAYLLRTISTFSCDIAPAVSRDSGRALRDRRWLGAGAFAARAGLRPTTRIREPALPDPAHAVHKGPGGGLRRAMRRRTYPLSMRSEILLLVQSDHPVAEAGRAGLARARAARRGRTGSASVPQLGPSYRASPRFAPRPARPHPPSDPLRELYCPVAHGGLLDDRADRGGESLRGQLLRWRWLGAGACAVNRRAPEVLFALERADDGGPSGKQSGGGRPRAPVMDDRGNAWKQPPMWRALDHDAVATHLSVDESTPARRDHGACARLLFVQSGNAGGTKRVVGCNEADCRPGLRHRPWSAWLSWLMQTRRTTGSPSGSGQRRHSCSDGGS